MENKTFTEMNNTTIAPKKKNKLKTAIKATGIVFGSILAVAIVLFCIEPIRLNFLNYMLDAFPEKEYAVTGTVENGIYTDERVTLGYVPEGFDVVTFDTSKISHFIEFKGNNGSFCFDMTDLDAKSSIDTEDATVSDILINGYEGKYITSHKYNSVLWHNTYNAFFIYGNIEKSELIKIAENVRQ